MSDWRDIVDENRRDAAAGARAPGRTPIYRDREAATEIATLDGLALQRLGARVVVTGRADMARDVTFADGNAAAAVFRAALAAVETGDFVAYGAAFEKEEKGA